MWWVKKLENLCGIWLLCFVICAPGFTFEANEGERCSPKSEDICVQVPDCTIAREAIKLHKRHGLQRCGFVGKTELVCCPPSDSLTQIRGSSSVRKSKQACDDVSNELAAELNWQILGGEDVLPGEFPHVAALGYRQFETNEVDFLCGGSLISNRYVLTAAHCVVSQRGPPEIVRLGKVDLTGNSDKVEAVDRGIENITVHPRYQRRSKENDIALLRLNNSIISSNTVRYACLYNREDDPKGLTVTGWGATTVNGPSSPNALQKATLVPVNISECNSTYIEASQRSLVRSQLCAVSTDGSKDSCQGDSGGPIQVQLSENKVVSIVGITSFGSGCGGTTPGVYTRVYSFLDWIESIVWP